jgi:hypothetical protein
MADDLNDMINQLKLERTILRDGGYKSSRRSATETEQLLRDSATCLNVGLTVQRHPCSDCLLWEFVPNGRMEEDIPCHHIPLNADCETIAGLEEKGDHEGAKNALLQWLDCTISELEAELAKRASSPPA